jgi:hypothetical protein
MKAYDSDLLFKRSLLLFSALLFVWSSFVSLYHQQSYEAMGSAFRIFLEISLVFAVFGKKNFNTFIIYRLIIAISVINGVIVVFQILEDLQISPTSFNRIIDEFWGLPVNEVTRKPGIFNGVLTSSLVSFLGLAILMQKRGLLVALGILVCALPIFFGARSFLIFGVLLVLSNWRLALALLASIVMVSALTLPEEMSQAFSTHVEERILPTALVVLTLDPAADYSSKDLVQNQYRMPFNAVELMIGNGHPRYSELGGQDPATGRWLLQVGFPGLVMLMAIILTICLRIALIGGVANVIFGASLVFGAFKGELITASFILSIVAFYAMTGNAYSQYITNSTNNVR